MSLMHEPTTPVIPVQATPGRGDRLPDLSGLSPDGGQISTRDYYMRRNLAIIFICAQTECADWIAAAAAVRKAAHAENGEILLVLDGTTDTEGLPAIVDDDGMLAARCGLGEFDRPALFIVDRYGTIFAANRGPDAEAGLRPRDIPRWLEFIACRCS
ncbi:MAG TPA: hypothetical protein VEX37_05710 [Thermomicrobiales bacterium]|nr:hypothetical protein [Thermomicrobiales bacterium]